MLRITQLELPKSISLDLLKANQAGRHTLGIDVTGFESIKISGNCQQGVSKAKGLSALRRIRLSNEYLRERLKNNISLEICRYNAVTN